MAKKIELKNIGTRAPESWDKEIFKFKTQELAEELEELQKLLYANQKYSVLVVLQGMDAAGKDGLIKDVFSVLGPTGVSVSAFKKPTEKELSHDFLWRVHSEVPAKGQIKIFNRSHYEDILITRVHGYCDDQLAEKRIKAINDFEQLLEEHNNTVIIKCYLHISQERQQERLMERMTLTRKQWKHNPQDLEEAKQWDKYMEMYEEVFDKCDKVPWNIIPADQNWVKAYYLMKILVEELNKLDMEYPDIQLQNADS